MLNSQGLKFNFSLKIGSNFSQLADIVKSSSGGWRSVLESIQSNLKCFLEIDNVCSKVLTMRLTPLILKPWNMWPSLRLTGIIVPVPSLSSPHELMSSHIRSIAFDLSKYINFCSCDLQYIIKILKISTQSMR